MDRAGTQHHEQVAQRCAALEPVTIAIVDGVADDFDQRFATRAVAWTCARLEQAKLDSLARQYAWSEFA